MALIKCSECGNEISSEAMTCPKCGCKTEYGASKEYYKNRAIVDIIINVVLLLILVSSIILWINAGEFEQRRFIKRFDISEKIGLSLILFWASIVGLISYKLSKKKESSKIAPVYKSSGSSNNEWRCSCGMFNPMGRMVCVSCGRSRKNIQKITPPKGTWHCENCGRINQNYTGTCACGKSKP